MAIEYAAYPVTIAVESATPGTYTTIAGVIDIEGPGPEVDDIDVTTRDSGGYYKYIGGLIKAGEVTFDIIYDPDAATHAATGTGLMALLLAKTIKNWQVQWADTTPTKWTMAAFVKNFKPKAPLKEAQRASVTLKLTGSFTIA